MSRLFGFFIVFAMVSGIGAGWYCHDYLTPSDLKTAIMVFGVLTKIFLSLIKMIIAPLVLFTLITGIGHMEDAAQVGRIGFKTLAWFLMASIVSLVLGMFMVEWLQPGVGLHLQTVAGAVKAPSTANFTIEAFIDHVIPTSIIKAMADNEVLQIVIFATFVGTAISALGHKAPQIMVLAEQGAAIMLKVTETIMKLAPFAIFGALAKSIAEHGVDILYTYAKFVGGFYASLGILWIILIFAGFVFAGPRIFKVIAAVASPILLAFSTASSEAAYPKVLEAMPKAGVSRSITSFVLPLGYAFNLDGSIMYTTFATLFIAQANGVHFSDSQKFMMLFLLLITSKGIAGVPRASLVVIMATLTYFGYPDSWIGLVLGVDFLLDMGRSATNVVGNSVASTVIAKWEGQLGKPEETPAT